MDEWRKWFRVKDKRLRQEERELTSFSDDVDVELYFHDCLPKKRAKICEAVVAMAVTEPELLVIE